MELEAAHQSLAFMVELTGSPVINICMSTFSWSSQIPTGIVVYNHLCSRSKSSYLTACMCNTR